MILADGVYDGIANPWIHPSDYHANDRVSRSLLVKILESPHDYAWALDHREPVTPAMIRGDAIGCAVMEPERFLREYALQPDFGDERSPRVREERDLWLAEREGLTIIPKSVVGEVVQTIRALQKNESVMAVFRNGLIEPTICWTETVRGISIPLRCRPDVITYPDDGPFLWDLKTVQDATPSAFSRKLALDRLYFQTAMYLRGLTIATGVEHNRAGHIVAQVNPSYRILTSEVPWEDIELGLQEYEHALGILARCIETGQYPDFTDRIYDVGLPPWYRRDLRQRLEGETTHE